MTRPAGCVIIPVGIIYFFLYYFIFKFLIKKFDLQDAGT